MDQREALHAAREQASRYVSETAVQLTPRSYGTAIARVPTFKFAQFEGLASVGAIIDLMGEASFTLTGGESAMPVLAVKYGSEENSVVLQHRDYLIRTADGVSVVNEREFREGYEVVK